MTAKVSAALTSINFFRRMVANQTEGWAKFEGRTGRFSLTTIFYHEVETAMTRNRMRTLRGLGLSRNIFAVHAQLSDLPVILCREADR